MKHLNKLLSLVGCLLLVGCSYSDKSGNTSKGDDSQELSIYRQGIQALNTNQFKSNIALWGQHELGSCYEGMNIVLFNDDNSTAESICSTSKYDDFLINKDYIEIILSKVDNGEFEVTKNNPLDDTIASKGQASTASVRYVLDRGLGGNNESYKAHGGKVIIKNLVNQSRKDYLDNPLVSVELKDIQFYNVPAYHIVCTLGENDREICECTMNDKTMPCERNSYVSYIESLTHEVFKYNRSFMADVCKLMTYGPNLALICNDEYNNEHE